MTGDIPQELQNMAASVGRDLPAEYDNARRVIAEMNRRKAARVGTRRTPAATEVTGPNTWAVTPGRTGDDLTHYRLITGPGFTA